MSLLILFNQGGFGPTPGTPIVYDIYNFNYKVFDSNNYIYVTADKANFNYEVFDHENFPEAAGQ